MKETNPSEAVDWCAKNMSKMSEADCFKFAKMGLEIQECAIKLYEKYNQNKLHGFKGLYIWEDEK